MITNGKKIMEIVSTIETTPFLQTFFLFDIIILIKVKRIVKIFGTIFSNRLLTIPGSLLKKI